MSVGLPLRKNIQAGILGHYRTNEVGKVRKFDLEFVHLLEFFCPDIILNVKFDKVKSEEKLY
jgi:hypothetical protein